VPAGAAVVAAGALLAFAAPARAQKWTADASKAAVPARPAAGKIHGLPFSVEKAELKNGILEIRQGKDFFPDRAVMVFLFLKQGESPEGHTFTVAPGAGFGSPHIHMKWRANPAADELPKTDMFMDRYTMRLAFGKAQNGKVPGRIYLCTPDAAKSYVAGTFTATVGR
jgi:hypothetical protein